MRLRVGTDRARVAAGKARSVPPVRGGPRQRQN